MRETPAAAYIAPFAVFIALRWLPVSPEWLAPVRLGAVICVIALLSRQALPKRISLIATSIALGAVVMILWIGPDLVWPNYRDFWLFHNRVMGAARSSLPAHLKSNPCFIVVRIIESALVVPVIEELFWRGWLMRWLIRADFENVPIGEYTAFSFWATALLFGSEHGPYWDVGILAGIAYNWWCVRARNLASCMLAHAVTNGLLAAYILVFGRWQYWM